MVVHAFIQYMKCKAVKRDMQNRRNSSKQPFFILCPDVTLTHLLHKYSHLEALRFV